MGRFLPSGYQYDSAWRSLLTQDFMDPLKRPVGTIYFTLYCKPEPCLVTMTGDSGQWGCGISSQTWIKGLAGWDFENRFVVLLLLPLFHSCWRMCSTLFLPHPGLSWNLPSCFRVLSVRVCCALAHIDITRAFSNCGLRRTPLQVPWAKFISKPKDSKLPLSFFCVPRLCPPGRLVQLARHCGNERVYVCFFGLETVIFCWITLWADSWGTKTVSVWF